MRILFKLKMKTYWFLSDSKKTQIHSAAYTLVGLHYVVLIPLSSQLSAKTNKSLERYQRGTFGLQHCVLVGILSVEGQNCCGGQNSRGDQARHSSFIMQCLQGMKSFNFLKRSTAAVTQSDPENHTHSASDSLNYLQY